MDIEAHHLTQTKPKDIQRWMRYGEPTSTFLWETAMHYGAEVSNLIAQGIDMYKDSKADKAKAKRTKQPPEPIEGSITTTEVVHIR